MATSVQSGDLVQIHYSTYSTDECVIETSENREPFEFTVGGSGVIRGLSAAVLGMQVGEQKRFSLPPELAFGRRDPRLVQTVALTTLPERVQEGDQLSVEVGGKLLDVWVKSRTETEAVLDANHPLVDESLIFEIEVISRQPAAVRQR